MSFKNNSKYTLIFIIFLTSFALGVIFTLQLDKNLNNNLLKSIDFSYDNKNSELNLDKYFNVYNTIKKEYFDTNSINNEKLLESSIKGLVDGLGDKHSSYLNMEEYKSFSESLSGDFEGIGAVVEIHPLGVKIDRIIKGSPAKKYDLRTGDILVSANGVKLEGLSLYDAVNNIKGPAGTKVNLEVIRSGENEILIKEVTRDKIKIPSIDYKLLDENRGYISINMFGEETSRDFESALLELRETDGLIIDLRDNGGGYLLSAVEILSRFVESGKPLVITKYRENVSNDIYESINFGNIYSGKIVVLINENSASASEILAGTLRDYNKAIIVGKKSYGKGSVQKPFDLPDGSMIKLTVAKWFTPKGTNIDLEGITPDIEVGFKDEDYTNMYDRQKEEAIKILNIFIEKDAFKLSIDNYNNNLKENLDEENISEENIDEIE